jgi:hypothetical protein
MLLNKKGKILCKNICFGKLQRGLDPVPDLDPKPEPNKSLRGTYCSTTLLAWALVVQWSSLQIFYLTPPLCLLARPQSVLVGTLGGPMVLLTCPTLDHSFVVPTYLTPPLCLLARPQSVLVGTLGGPMVLLTDPALDPSFVLT